MKMTLGFTLVVFVLVVSAFAQDQGVTPDAVRGQVLARRWCAACHLTALRLTPIDPPTFTAIANDPSKTPDYLRGFFVGPHKDMPPIQLTAAQIEDFIVYFGTLKRGQ